MLRIYHCIVHEHDLRLVGLAAVICLFASVTSLVLLQRSASPSHGWRPGWLALAGITTGLGIWTTHFTAMLAYAPGLRLGFDPMAALASVLIGSLLATAGWAVGFSAGRGRATLGGGLVGVGLACAHYVDVASMVVNGTIVQDDGLIMASLFLGVALCALAGWSQHGRGESSSPLVPAAILSAGILSLHFVGMSALTIIPRPSMTPVTALLEINDVGGLVVFAAVLLLIVAASVAFNDLRLARKSLADNQGLETVVAALRESEERYRLAAKATSDAIWVWRHADDTVEWGEGICARLGYEEARTGTSLAWWSQRVHPDDLPRILDSLDLALAGPSNEWSGEYRFLKGDGTYADIHAQGHIVRDANGTPRHTVGAMIDITDRKRGERNLRWAAEHDPLTELPNRLLFNARLGEQLERGVPPSSTLTLILIDIDHFKVVNDTMGHGAGDALLLEIAARLKASVPPDSMVARLGGDEFAILVLGHEPDEVMDRAQAMIEAVKQPFSIDGRQIDASVSAGVSMWPEDASSSSELLKAADLALYAAKAEGRAVVRRFRPEMRIAIDRRASMLSDARKALNDDNVVPFYQPKISLATGELEGFESLLRWHHSEHGLQSPARIAAAFEDLELSAKLTERMVDKVLVDMRRWLDAGLEFGRIAINGSAADFRRGDFGDRLLEHLHRANRPPSYLELEVTETVFVGQIAEQVESTLQLVSKEGMTVALDDFGTGYASLTHLRQFPVDVIKIDRSFVSRLNGSDGHEDDAIVRALVSLARNLGMGCVAEGVETAQQAAQLRDYGCDLAQGYYFSRAIAAERVSRLIKASGTTRKVVPLGKLAVKVPRREASVTRLPTRSTRR